LAEAAGERLFQLEIHRELMLCLSNVHGRNGPRIKKLIKDRRVPKIPGCSSAEVGGSVHEFIAYTFMWKRRTRYWIGQMTEYTTAWRLAISSWDLPSEKAAATEEGSERPRRCRNPSIALRRAYSLML
ncbi:hypothetical protein Taro_012862, partial [Colocasia esculenta]|nr:hypothetical protein [Colocasia esculenta]